ncbi:hypothetical protein BDZ45DRAFT_679833 [Acephala macrosclerotiorum]|nr:hypothetical protein BDZ45DRAFT_679833 [Acephala macrosclerotiorum]
MKRARIDLSGLRHLAEDVLDDSTTVATSSTSSLPETQRSPPRNHPWPHYHQSSAQRRTRREVPETVPVVVQDFVYRQPSPERHPQRPRGNRYPHYHDQPEQPVQEPIGMQMPQRPRGIGGESLCPEPHTLPPIPRPQPQRNEPRPRQYHDHSELPPRRPIATQTARQIVPVIAHDAAYNHQPLSLRRRDDVPLRDHPIRERGAIQQPPPPSNLPQVDRTQQSSMRGRPRSIHQDSSGHGLPLPPGHRRHAASSLPIDEHSTAGRESIRRPPPQNYHPRQDQRPRYTSSRSRSHSVDHESVAEGVVQPTRHQRLAADAVPIRLHPTPERVATRPPPPTSHHPREDLRQHHSSTRSRSRSIDYCSGAEDVLQPPKHRRPDVNDRKYPPNAFKDPEAKPQKLRKRSRSRSDSGYGSVSGRSSDAEESGSMRSRSGSSSLSREYGPRYESSRPSECGSLLPEDHPRERRHSRRRSVRE